MQSGHGRVILGRRKVSPLQELRRGWVFGQDALVLLDGEPLAGLEALERALEDG